MPLGLEPAACACVLVNSSDYDRKSARILDGCRKQVKAG